MEVIIPLRSIAEEQTILGPYDRHARLLRELLGVTVVSRKGSLKLIGAAEEVAEAHRRLQGVLDRLRAGEDTTPEQVRQLLDFQSARESEAPAESLVAGEGAANWLLGTGEVELERRTPAPERAAGARAEDPAHHEHASESPSIRIVLPSGVVEPRTAGQAEYLRNIRDHALSFAVGPAGTGKTYLAVAMAVEALRRGDFRRLVLARPAVEAGEKLGFLPGDFQAKIHPYLRPLYDALNDLLDPNASRRYFENDVLEVIPLAFMRGRTLNASFIILDEAQNTTVSQMMMFLTRMGYGSKIVVTGDVTQIDLPKGVVSGLVDVCQRLKGVEGVAFSTLDRTDIVRHPLVQRIVDAYVDRSDRGTVPEPNGPGGADRRGR